MSLELPEIGDATFLTKLWVMKAEVLLKMRIHYFYGLQENSPEFQIPIF